MQDSLVVVVAGGVSLRPDVASLIPTDARVLAADAGVAHARALGLHVTAVIGDFDSASSAEVDRAVAAGARIERHPTDKDETDLELTLDAALELEPSSIVVLADAGGRLDHVLSALLLLAAAKYVDVEIDAQIGAAFVHVIRDERALQGRPGDLVSLLALHGLAEGVRTEGLAYPLVGETLEPGSSRGVSNVFVGSDAGVQVERGVVLAVRPGLEAGAAL